MPMNSKLDVLKKCPLFVGCTEAELKEIWDHSKFLSVKRGDPIFVINDPSKSVYLVLKGSIHIIGQGNVKNQYPRLRTVNVNEHFSDLSVLVGDRHQTSAFAAEASELMSLDGEYFLEAIRTSPHINRNQRDTLVQYYIDNIRHSFTLPYLNDAAECRLDRNFAQLAPLKLPAGRKAVPIRIESDIVTVGFCLPISREFIDSFHSHYAGYKIKLTILEPALYETLRKSYLGFVSGQVMPPAMTSTIDAKTKIDINDNLDDLRQSTLLLSQLSNDVFKRLVPHFQVLDYAEGDVIFSPNLRSDNLFILRSGEVELSKEVEGLGVNVAYRTVDQYDAFFDTLLFEKDESRVTAIARSRCRVFALKKDVFHELLKVGDFAVPFSITMAQIIQATNKTKPGIEFYSGQIVTNSQTEHLLPHSKILQWKILPLEVSDKDLTLGVVSPRKEVLDEAIQSYLRAYNVKMRLITEENFEQWSSKSNASSSPSETTAIFKNSSQDERLLRPVNADPSQALEQILIGALENRASDIHFEPNEKYLIVRYRIDGVIIQLWSHIPVEVGSAILRRVKVLAQMDIAETRLPQDGQFTFKKADFEGSFRVSSVPTRFGEKFVLRATGRKNSVIPLPLLAPDTKITKFFNRLVKYQQGIFLITGPTGSGKSTTLYSILNELNTPDRNIITIEDPIEANITGINQIEIKPDIGLTHESILRNVLRQDPDVIMVGEIRDSVSMQMALNAALSGQLVLTTIHAGNTIEVLPRMRELGAHTSHIASGLIGVMSQRLVRCLCTQCKRLRAVTAKEVELFQQMEFDEPVIQLMDAVGCSHCNFTGFSGQIPIFEFWEKTIHVHNALIDGSKSEEIARAIKKSNMESLTTYGLKMVTQGLTTVSEINDVLFGIADLMAS